MATWIQTSHARFNRHQKALLVVAHPDDEVMFFSPLLQWASGCNEKMHILCLSTGNFEGLGEIRKQELARCVELFDIPPDCIQIIDHPALADGMDNLWPIDTISSLVVDYISKVGGVDLVFTFDDYGVSGHPNHIATFHGVRHALFSLSNNQGAPSTKGYCLSSKSVVRKFLGILDVPMSMCLEEHVLVSWSLMKTIWGMQEHNSQNVWYRKIFILISCFSFVNCFTEIKEL